MRRLAALLMAAALCCGAGCAGRGGASEPETLPAQGQTEETGGEEGRTDVVRLAVTEGDTLNPYTCRSLQNEYLSGLLYDPLVALSPSFEAKPRIAREVLLTGYECVLTLREDAVFSDGSAVTSADVVYSIQYAMAAERFAAQLAGIAGVAAEGDYTVRITLSAQDSLFDRALAIPVIKAGSAKAPIGCGRFLLSASEENVLLPNPAYYSPVENMSRIDLVTASTQDEQNYAVMFGEVDLVYSDLRGGASLGVGTGRRQVSLTSLLFVGVNRAKWGFTDAQMTTLNTVLPRGDVAAGACSGYAVAVSTPANPAYSGATTAVRSTLSAEEQGALLEEAGFTQPEGGGMRRYRGYRMTLTMIVSDGSQLRQKAADEIAAGYAALGIDVAVTAVPAADFPAYIEQGAYDLYLGETQVSPNWNIYSLLTPNGSFGTGTVWDDALISAYLQVKSGELTLDAFSEVFSARPAFFPVAYRRGAVCFFRDFSANIIATQQDIFYNIQEW